MTEMAEIDIYKKGEGFHRAVGADNKKKNAL